jgi:hypothetical protein
VAVVVTQHTLGGGGQAGGLGGGAAKGQGRERGSYVSSITQL